MAERRMFAKSIIDSDMFLDMPLSTQALYFHLSMRADDEGFVNSPKKIQKMLGCADDDLKLLVAKQFIIPFESGVVVIKHWRIHNYIQSDRFKPTMYIDEKSKLISEKGKGYELSQGDSVYTPCIQSVSNMDTQVRKGKDRLVKVRLDYNNVTEDEKDTYLDFVKLTKDEYSRLIDKFGEEKTKGCIEILNNYIGAIGIKKASKYKSHYFVILNWVHSRYDEEHKYDKPKGDVEVWG